MPSSTIAVQSEELLEVHSTVDPFWAGAFGVPGDDAVADLAAVAGAS